MSDSNMNVPARNKQIIERFYNEGFAKANSALMGGLYDDAATFSDAAFGHLQDAKARAMWQMLFRNHEKNGTKPDFEVSAIEGDDSGGTAHWECRYPSPVRPALMVHNKVDAKFVIDASTGKILVHEDTFDWWEWASQALGAVGWALGGFEWFHKVVQNKTVATLDAFIEKRLSTLND